MITTALLPLVLLAPMDSPIEPITVTDTLVALAEPAATEVCGQIAEMADLFDLLGVVTDDPTLPGWLYDMAVAYFIQAAEEGDGPNSAFTAEATATFVGWVDDCSGRTYNPPA